MDTGFYIGSLAEVGAVAGAFHLNCLSDNLTSIPVPEISAASRSCPTNTPQAPQGVKSTREESIIPAFFWDGKRYVLKNPVPYTVEEEDGYFTFECPTFDMLSCAEGREAALEQFNEEFAAIYDMFANEPNANLSADTIELKNKLRSMVTVKTASK